MISICFKCRLDLDTVAALTAQSSAQILKFFFTIAPSRIRPLNAHRVGAEPRAQARACAMSGSIGNGGRPDGAEPRAQARACAMSAGRLFISRQWLRDLEEGDRTADKGRTERAVTKDARTTRNI